MNKKQIFSEHEAHLANSSDGARMSQKTQANEFKSTNVKLTSKNCSLTTMTIENRRFSFISAILSLSPRHGHRSLESGNKKYTSRMNSNIKIYSFFNSLISSFCSSSFKL
jgi:hypothetical protein